MANIADDLKVQALLDKQQKVADKALAAAAKAAAASTKAAYKAAVTAVKGVITEALGDVKGDKIVTAKIKDIQKDILAAIALAQVVDTE
jgi:hypothetical protein